MGEENIKHIIHIPNWHPISVNQLLSVHWRRRKSIKDVDLQMIAAYARQERTPKAKGKRKLKAVITLGKGQRACDPDNYTKSLYDNLKRAGMIKDDNRQWLETEPMEFNRATEKATTIILEDI